MKKKSRTIDDLLTALQYDNKVINTSIPTKQKISKRKQKDFLVHKLTKHNYVLTSMSAYMIVDSITHGLINESTIDKGFKALYDIVRGNISIADCRSIILDYCEVFDLITYFTDDEKDKT